MLSGGLADSWSPPEQSLLPELEDFLLGPRAQAVGVSPRTGQQAGRGTGPSGPWDRPPVFSDGGDGWTPGPWVVGWGGVQRVVMRRAGGEDTTRRKSQPANVLPEGSGGPATPAAGPLATLTRAGDSVRRAHRRTGGPRGAPLRASGEGGWAGVLPPFFSVMKFTFPQILNDTRTFGRQRKYKTTKTKGIAHKFTTRTTGKF